MHNEPALIDKVALVLGGSRGIGAAIVRRLAANGASVAVTYANSAEKAAKTARAAEAYGQPVIAIKADSADPTAVVDGWHRLSHALAIWTFWSSMPGS